MAVADEIAKLEAILDAGVRSVSSDGTSVQYDPAEIRRRLAVLRRESDGTSPKRPRNSQIDLSGF